MPGSSAGGIGNDSLLGGAGDDIYLFAGNYALGTDSITEAAAADSDTLDFTGTTFGVGLGDATTAFALGSN